MIFLVWNTFYFFLKKGNVNRARIRDNAALFEKETRYNSILEDAYIYEILSVAIKEQRHK